MLPAGMPSSPGRGAVATADDPLLRVDGLSVRFPARGRTGGRKFVHAVSDVTFELRRGETLGIVGESGSGKSTLGFTVMGQHKPASGKVLFQGVDVFRTRREELRGLRRDMQFVYQDPFGSLNPRMRIGDIVAEPLLSHGVFRSAREARTSVVTVLERCGLSSSALSKYPGQFSGGQRQRIVIARAMILEPSLLIADEPTSALDVSIQAQILRLFADLRKEGDVSYIMISHDLGVVRHACSRVMVMYLGRVVETGPTSAVFEHPQHPYTKALLASIPRVHPLDVPHGHYRLGGEMPSSIDPPLGCPFHSRCPIALEECAREVPLLRGNHEHAVACLRVGAPD